MNKRRSQIVNLTSLWYVLNWMIRKLLITGSSGFLGSHVLDILKNHKSGLEVHAIYNEHLPNINASHIIYHQLDLRDINGLHNLLEEVEPKDLLHLAWLTDPDVVLNSSDNTDWIYLSLHLIEKFGELGGRKAVFIGSCFEYDWDHVFCTENFTPLKARNFYGKAKLSLFDLASHVAHQLAVNFVWARPFYVYGPRENPKRIVPVLINRLLNNQQFVYTQGTKMRDFMFVEDTAQALLTLLGTFTNGPVNIATGSSIAVGDFMRLIAERCGKKELLTIKEETKSSVLMASINKLRFAGFTSSTPMIEAIDKTIDYWKERQND